MSSQHESNPLWYVNDINMFYSTYEEKSDPGGNYTEVNFKVAIKRRSGFFVSSVILPSILINYLSLASFLVPAHSDENIEFSVTIFLAQTVNMMSTSQFIPNGGIVVPIWGKYLLVSIIFLSLVILINIAMNNGIGVMGTNYTRSKSRLCFNFVKVKFLNFKMTSFGEPKTVTALESHGGTMAEGTIKNLAKNKDEHEFQPDKRPNNDDLKTTKKVIFFVGFATLSFITIATLLLLTS